MKKESLELFSIVSKSILISFIFYVAFIYRSLFFYMDIYDIFSYISLTFISMQGLAVIITIAIIVCVLIYERGSNKENTLKYLNPIIDDFGNGVGFFCFIIVLDRFFINQYWLNIIKITEIVRISLELAYGIFIVCLSVILGFRRRSKRKPQEIAEASEGHQPSINRRLFITATTSVAAATTIGTRFISQERFKQNMAAPEKGGNILLITFDALAAEDMSLYGYRLNTTPNIDSFATKSAVHDSFYSCSTFTTPGIATILTGRYPSQSHIYHLGGMLYGQDIYRTLPALLKASGYNTGSVFGNPYAMRLMGSTHGAFDYLAEAPRAGWTSLLPGGMMELPGAIDIVDLNQKFVTLGGLAVPQLRETESRTPPRATFEAAQAMIAGLKSPYFAWIHVMAPHAPYLPSSDFRYSFLKPGRFESRQDMLHPKVMNRNKSPAEIQTDIEMLRLRYNEWILETDNAFGNFISSLESNGRLDDTSVIISADHGEYFSDDSFGHGGDDFIRSLIHIPMIIRRPGQFIGERIRSFADQTSIAPTILDLAGIAVPDWMPSAPLKDTMAAPGMAVTQYLERNSAFGRPATGTIGAMFGGYQYIRSMTTGSEKLYSNADADRHFVNIAGDAKGVVEEARETLRMKFPEFSL